MQKYDMEFKKFSTRKFSASYPITAIRMHKILCQDVLFDLTSNYIEVDSFLFSKAFFYDFYKIRDRVEWDTIYVLDGVAVLHKFSGSDKPLVRDRALYSFLYLPEDSSSSFAEALITNPWLNNLCERPFRLLSERVAVIKSTIKHIASSVIYKAILEDLDNEFTPRGIWGMDYMFRWKPYHLEPQINVNENIKLIPLEEYVASFNKE